MSGLLLKMSQVLNEFEKLKSSGSDLTTVLQHIRENSFFSTFCNASKRNVTVADYCAYYLLYPYMVFVLVSCDPGNIGPFEWERSLSELLYANAEHEEYPLKRLRPSGASTQAKEAELASIPFPV